MIRESIDENIEVWAVKKYAEEWEWTNIEVWLFRNFGIKYEIENKDEINQLTKEAVKTDIYEKIFEVYKKRQEELTVEVMLQVQRMILLQMIDSSWKDHLYELDQLRNGIGFRAYAQKDPKIEYQKESFALFESMMNRIRENTIEYIFKVHADIKPRRSDKVRMESDFFVKNENLKNENLKNRNLGNINFGNVNLKSGNNNNIAVKSLKKIGRNDQCPCGSGKKYKKCCGA
jgi:preprotein translocase subunit SecA